MPYRIVISGGGTGGHVFPALSIAGAVQKLRPGTELLFVGALGRLEMEKVPAAGYKIIGLPIMGMPRKFSVKLFPFVINWLRSLLKARRILKQFNPHAVIGVGGYASAPVLQMSTRMGIISVIQEQNSYAGIVNRSVAHKVDKICVAYPGMEKYFPCDRIILTGNPVRGDLINVEGKRDEAMRFFSLSPEQKVVLVLGGSLGAGTINRSIRIHLPEIKDQPVQFLWQCGKIYLEESSSALEQSGNTNVRLLPFIERMDLAFAVADVIISRAGAGSISELCIVGKPVILVPSPNVAEDHQTKNALSLSNREAAILIPDAEAPEKLVSTAFGLLRDTAAMNRLSTAIRSLAVTDAAEHIAREVFDLIENKEK